MSDNAIAGLLGNIFQESGFIANNLENSKEGLLGSDAEYTAKVDDGSYKNFANDGAGYGIAQWTSPGRKQALLNYAKSKGVSIGDENMQIEFLLAELGIHNSASAFTGSQLSSYKGYDIDSWKNAKSPEEAAEAFCWLFEKPSDASSGMSSRKNKAKEVYERYSGKTRPSTSGGGSVSSGKYNFPHYLQENYSGSYGSATIASDGCGPTSLAMILSGLKGDSSITPASFVENLKQYYPDGRYHVSGVGSTGDIYNSSFLSKYYGVSTQMYPTESQALQALEQGYPVLGHENGHFLAVVPVSDELKAQGYKFYILDSYRGHDGAYKSVADANKVVDGQLTFRAIIRP